MTDDTRKLIGAIVASLVMAVAGFAGGGYADMTGAKSWKEAQKEEIEAAARLKDRVRALEAQQAILMQLVAGDVCEPYEEEVTDAIRDLPDSAWSAGGMPDPD